jgi:hypothetical protein
MRSDNITADKSSENETQFLHLKVGNEKPYDNKVYVSCFCVGRDSCISVILIVNL